jgi:hypothetical protein
MEEKVVELHKTLAGLGVPVETDEKGSLSVVLKGHKIPAQTCEVALLAMEAVCNFAVTDDRRGYNKSDAPFGHDLAQSVRKYGRLTPKQLAAVVMPPKDPKTQCGGILRKYQKQLRRMGFDTNVLFVQAPLPRAEVAPEAAPVEAVGEPKESDGLTVIATLLGETEKAYKLRLARPDGKSMDFWVPKSKVVREDDSFTIPGWKVKEAALDKFLAGDVQLTA